LYIVFPASTKQIEKFAPQKKYFSGYAPCNASSDSYLNLNRLERFCTLFV